MWSPTHVQVTVKRGIKLLTKGNNNTNDCFVSIELGKEKFQTSLKHKAGPDVEWNEECDLLIPTQGNTAELVLTALHRNTFSIDEFLGQVRIPLSDFDVYERPKTRLYKLEAKKGKVNKKERGSLEVRIGFLVKSGSLTNLNKKDKHKSSLDHLSNMKSNIASSLLSLSSLEKRKGLGLGKVAHSLRKKIKPDRKKDQDEPSPPLRTVGHRTADFRRSFTSAGSLNANVDPGVISEDDDEFAFDDLSHGSANSLRLTADTVTELVTPATPPSVVKPLVDEWSEKLMKNKSSTLPMKKSPSIANIIQSERKLNVKDVSEVNDVNKRHETQSRANVDDFDGDRINDDDIPAKYRHQFEGKSKVDLIKIILKLQDSLDSSKQRTKELESYLDEILARVMDTTPSILQRPYEKQFSMSYVL